MVVVRVDIDVLQVELVHHPELLLDRILLRVQGPIHRAGCGLRDVGWIGVCEVEEAVPCNQCVPVERTLFSVANSS